jgi:hypothetical protein
MFLASEAVKTFTAFELLLAFLQAIAFVIVIIWAKVALYRRPGRGLSGERPQPRDPYHRMTGPSRLGAKENWEARLPQPIPSRRAMRKRGRKLRNRAGKAAGRGARLDLARPSNSPHSLRSTSSRREAPAILREEAYL